MAFHDRSVNLIHLESGRYPVSVHEFMSLTPGFAWGEFISDELFTENGYAVVYQTERPEGDVVEEASPVCVYGAWMQEWKSRDYTAQEQESIFEQSKRDLLSFIRDQAVHRRSQGLKCEFSNGVFEHIQIRELDLIRLRGLKDIAISHPERPIYFRTLENNLQPLQGWQMGLLCDAAFEADRTILAVTWHYQSVVQAAVSKYELPSHYSIIKEFQSIPTA